MNRKVVYALILIGISVIVLVVNRERISLNLLFTEIKSIASFVFLGFTALGVLIGLLLK